MNYRIFLIIAGILCALLLSAGCTQAPVTPPATTVATTVPTTVPMTSTPAPTTAIVTPAPTTIGPGPVETLPPQYDVTIDVDRNVVATDPKITTTFRGGKGINFVTSMEVTVNRSTGTSETQQIIKPKMNDQIVIQGTTGTDRVTIRVTTADGKTYLIYDQMMPFRQYS
jgi:hypothetical protein